jgi:hypothetical protein
MSRMQTMIKKLSLIALLALAGMTTPVSAGPRSDGSEALLVLEAPGVSKPSTETAPLLDRLDALEGRISKIEGD